jgi:hypothetical protein
MEPRSTMVRPTVAALVAAAVAFIAGYAPVRDLVAASGLYSPEVVWLYPLLPDAMFVVAALVFVLVAVAGGSLAWILLMAATGAVNVWLCVTASGPAWVVAAALAVSTYMTYRLGALLRAAPPWGVRG